MAMDVERVWLYSPETQNFFLCPAAAAPAWIARGWVASEAPAETNPALGEFTRPAPPAAAETPPAETPKPDKPARGAAATRTEGVTS